MLIGVRALALVSRLLWTASHKQVTYLLIAFLVDWRSLFLPFENSCLKVSLIFDSSDAGGRRCADSLRRDLATLL